MKVLLLISFIFTLLSTGFGNPTDKKHIAIAEFTTDPPKIDGRVDKCWQEAHEQHGFLQRTPYPGKKATYDTKFYALYDKNNLYLLFIMLDKHPEEIPSRLVERDYRFSPDDNINFYLDTYNDHRKAYLFSTNPAGVEQDGLVSNNGSSMDMNWDGIFDVAARRNKFGWVAEFSIPLTTLRFDDSRPYQVWGFNVMRVRKEEREISYWSLVDQNYGMLRLDKGGVLVLKGVKSGRHMEFLPYFTSAQTDGPGQYKKMQPLTGLDAKFGLTSDLTLNATINPDFGQVEIDQEQINLDKRVELSLPEKRPFFLENVNLFKLPIQTFYSRRIGSRSDIQAGAKLTGKAGPYSIGFLGAKTGQKLDFDSKNNSANPENEWFSALRVQRDVLNNSSVGLMLTDREAQPGRPDYQFNRSYSMDWNIFLGRYQSFFGQVVRSANSGKGGEGTAAIARLSHFDQKYWFYLQGFYYEEQFNVDGTGFFPRIPGKGHKELNLYLETHPLVNAGMIRSWGASSQYRITKDTQEDKVGYGVLNRVWAEAPNQTRLELSAAFYREEETDFLGRFQPLLYNGRDLMLTFNTDPGRDISLRMSVSDVSQYYFQTHTVGFNRGLKADLLFKPVSNAFFEAGYELRQFLDNRHKPMPSELIGQDNDQIFSLRGRYLFTKNLFSRTFLQYTNGGEQFRFILNSQNQYELRYDVFDRVTADFVLGWRYRPGSTLFLVYTGEWNNLGGGSLSLNNRTILFKFSYLWSM